MSIFSALAAWLETLPSLAQFAPGGIATGTLANARCALCDTGKFSVQTDISERQNIAHHYALVLRSATALQQNRVVMQQLCEEIAAQCAAMQSTNNLPMLPAPHTSEQVECGGAQFFADDSGLGTWTLQLTLRYAAERNFK